MKRMIAAVIAACLAPASGLCEETDDDLKRFERFATYDFKTQECESDEKGRFQFSCKKIETGDVSGYLKADTFKKNATGRFLEKYWGTGDRLKFIGIACGRGDTEDSAKKTASFRAQELVRRAVEGMETNVLIGDFQPLGYRKDEDRSRCVAVPRGKETASNDSSPPDLGSPLDDADDVSTSNAEAENFERQRRERQEREERQRLAAERERQSTMLVFDVKSLDKYAVELSFFSDTYRNRVWPGGSQIYLLKDSNVHTYRLNCRKGEKICYGAWRRGNPDSWWGAGYGGRKGCTNCCHICGGSASHTLMAGAETPSGGGSGGNAANALVDILGGVAAGMGAVNAARPRPAPVYRPAPAPTPQGLNRRQSTISGGR